MNESGVTKILTLGTAAGFAGVLATGFAAGWERFWVNWIVWFLFVLTIGLGCLFIVALEHVVGAKWSVPLRRVPERLSSLALLMAPALLLALLSLPVLYPWTRPGAQDDPIVAGKAVWLNVPFFVARGGGVPRPLVARLLDPGERVAPAGSGEGSSLQRARPSLCARLHGHLRDHDYHRGFRLDRQS